MLPHKVTMCWWECHHQYMSATISTNDYHHQHKWVLLSAQMSVTIIRWECVMVSTKQCHHQHKTVSPSPSAQDSVTISTRQCHHQHKTVSPSAQDSVTISTRQCHHQHLMRINLTQHPSHDRSRLMATNKCHEPTSTGRSTLQPGQ